LKINIGVLYEQYCGTGLNLDGEFLDKIMRKGLFGVIAGIQGRELN